MLSAIHTTIQRLLYERGGIPPEVEISFEQPSKQWFDSLLRPTINLFLFDIEENMDLRQTSLQTLRGNEGMAIQRMPARRFDLCYMVSALSSEIEDEHTLLWRTLAALLRYSPVPLELMGADMLATLLNVVALPPVTFVDEVAALFNSSDVLPATLLDTPLDEVLAPDVEHPLELRRKMQERRKAQEPLTLRAFLEDRMLPLTSEIGRIDNGPRALDLWGSLDVTPRPALFYTITAPVDLEIVFTRKMVFAGETRLRRPSAADEASGLGLNPDRAVAVGAITAISGIVRDRQQRPIAGVQVSVEGRAMTTTTDNSGRYTLEKLQHGHITLRLTQPDRNPQLVEVVIPADSYDITLD